MALHPCLLLLPVLGLLLSPSSALSAAATTLVLSQKDSPSSEAKTLEAGIATKDRQDHADEINRDWNFVSHRIQKVNNILVESDVDRFASARVRAVFQEMGNLVQEVVAQLEDDASRKKDDLESLAFKASESTSSMIVQLKDRNDLHGPLCRAATPLKLHVSVRGRPNLKRLGKAPRWGLLMSAYSTLDVASAHVPDELENHGENHGEHGGNVVSQLASIITVLDQTWLRIVRPMDSVSVNDTAQAGLADVNAAIGEYMDDIRSNIQKRCGDELGPQAPLDAMNTAIRDSVQALQSLYSASCTTINDGIRQRCLDLLDGLDSEISGSDGKTSDSDIEARAEAILREMRHGYVEAVRKFRMFDRGDPLSGSNQARVALLTGLMNGVLDKSDSEQVSVLERDLRVLDWFRSICQPK